MKHQRWLKAINDSSDVDLITMYGCCKNGNIELLDKLSGFQNQDLLRRLISRGFMTQDLIDEIVKRFSARAGIDQ